MLRTPPECRRLLEMAGYAWDEQRQAWVQPAHAPDPLCDRMLDGDVARDLTPEQVAAWIKAGTEPRREALAASATRPQSVAKATKR